MKRTATQSASVNSIKLVVDCTNWEKFCPLAFDTIDEVTLGSAMVLTHCNKDSYLRFCLLRFSILGIVRAVELHRSDCQELRRVSSGPLLYCFH